MGQGAGVAAALAVRDGTFVRDVSPETLKVRLRAQGAIIGPPGQ